MKPLLFGLAPLALALPAAAQDHSMHDMPGMKMPAKVAPKPAVKAKAPKPRAPSKPAPRAHAQQAPVPRDPHAGHDMGNMPGGEAPAPQSAAPADAADPHAGHDLSAMPAMAAGIPTGTDLPPGNAPPPAPASDRAANRYWGAGAMAEAEGALRREHGGMIYSKLLFNLLEYQAGAGADGYRWDGEAWIGGDQDRFVVRSEGSGAFRGGVDEAEVQALYGRALDPYWNLRAGVRQDLGPGPRSTWATLGVEGVAPYWLELEGALFLSTRGDLLGRIEGHYDQRITQDLVLQPRAELNLAAQDVPASAIGAGASDIELGLRLRYERSRELAPYLGVSWDRKLGDTAGYARRRGEGSGGMRFVAGIRSWF
ncbi:copper resistance protein CopB [Sphingomonas gei]|uniref:Copper resistance protein CopB n=1 Tax=Sphingomonas gei TaxID=1395960 RepID=A0A4S1XK61_9SPHN|nr:copper resistance protein B [Sphingomonas gei]TGX56220.1 copper resistance protein CopB [Sphingomonas gei]